MQKDAENMQIHWVQPLERLPAYTGMEAAAAYSDPKR